MEPSLLVVTCGEVTKKDSVASVRASIDNGVTTLDTAPFYGFGLSEEMIGEAIKGFDRSKIQLLTKFGLVWDGSNQEKENSSSMLKRPGKQFLYTNMLLKLV